MAPEKIKLRWVVSRDGTKKGEIKNLRSRPCQMEGCTGMRMHVKWPDGRSTFPCTKGCEQIDDETLKII